MINTKFNYYKTIKWKDIYIDKKYNNVVIKYSYNSKKLNKYTDKLIMRKLVKKFRKDNKTGNELNLISNKEQYYY